MCAKFVVPEAAFRLTSDIAHYPWQPTTAAARRCVPSDLVSQIKAKLLQIEAGLATAMGRSEQPVAGTADQHAAVDSLAAWLAKMEFTDLQPTLQGRRYCPGCCICRATEAHHQRRACCSGPDTSSRAAISLGRGACACLNLIIFQLTSPFPSLLKLYYIPPLFFSLGRTVVVHGT